MKKRTLRILSQLLFAALASSMLLFAQAPRVQKDNVIRHQYQGSLGPYRIGLTVVRRGNKIEGGHYFYQKFLRDIPISGSVIGSHISLTELGGDQFDLHFVGNGSEGHEPLDFENSIGMEGTWKSADGTRSYPVSLRGTTILEGTDSESRYITVTNESDAAFEARVQSFFRAILRGDKTTAVRFISYPLLVNFSNGTNKKFRNSAAVLSAWNDLFTPAMTEKLQRDLPHDMFVHNGMAMLGNGEAWFDAKGLAALNVP